MEVWRVWKHFNHYQVHYVTAQISRHNLHTPSILTLSLFF